MMHFNIHNIQNILQNIYVFVSVCLLNTGTLRKKMFNLFFHQAKKENKITHLSVNLCSSIFLCYKKIDQGHKLCILDKLDVILISSMLLNFML